MVNIIKEAIIHDAKYENLLKDEVNLNGTEFKVDHKGIIWFKRIIYMLDVVDLKLFVLNQMWRLPYAGHAGYQKMIIVLRKQLFWSNLKAYLVDYLSKCLECQ